jgi:predicted phage terminase large subunit-like protein
VFPCWTAETLDLDVDQQESIWEERFPSKVLRADKRGAIARNKLSVFAREMECRLVARERAQFLSSWLNLRDSDPPRGGYTILAIDPVPPPSERQLAKGLAGKDWETHYVWSRYGDQYHLVDFARSRGHDPTWSTSTFFTLMRKHRCAKAILDAVNYQRTLKWILEEEMKRRRLYYSIIPIADGMQKFARIVSVLHPLAAGGYLYVPPSASNFIEQFERYPDGQYDDDLDASALALQELSNPYLEFSSDDDSPLVESFAYEVKCP